MSTRRAALGAFALLIAAAATAAETSEVVSLNADRQEWIRDVLWCGVGSVEVRYQDITMRADEIDVDLSTMIASAAGNVTIDQGATRLAAARAEFDLGKKTGTLWNADGFFPPSYHFRGERIDKLDETHFRFQRGVFTSCTLDDRQPPWSISMRDAVVEMEGYGHFRGAAINVLGVPVFYAPRLLWPTKRDRAAGLLVPNIGYSNEHGALLGNALFVPLSRSFDTTLYLDLYSKGFVGIGDELRWAPAENAKGEATVQVMRDPDRSRWEWKLDGKHFQLLPGGWAIRAEALDFSDIDFFQRFTRTFDRNALRSVYSYGTVSRTWGPQALNLKIDHRKTFFGTNGSSSSAVVLERLPTLEYRLRSTRVGRTPLYVSLLSSADHLRVDRSATLRGDYSRLDVFPTMSLLLPGWSWLNVTPSAGARETYYTARYDSKGARFVADALSRHYAIAGLSIVGPSFSRVWAGETAKVKHLIEPRIEYSFVSDPRISSEVPLFDEKDSVVVTNRVRYTLANRLFLKSGDAASREVASLEISQEHSFSEPLIAARPDLGLDASSNGPLSIWLRAAPAPTIALDLRSDIDLQTKNLRSSSLTGFAVSGPTSLGLTWFTSYNPATGAVTSSQSRIAAGLSPGSGALRFETALAYDVHQSKLLEQRYVLRYRGSCWSVFGEVRDYRIPPYTTRDYRIAIDLTGLGTFLDIRGSLSPLLGQ